MALVLSHPSDSRAPCPNAAMARITLCLRISGVYVLTRAPRPAYAPRDAGPRTLMARDAALDRSPLFEGLDDDELDIVAGHMRPRQFEPDEQL